MDTVVTESLTNSLPNLVAFCSAAAQSGKSTSADVLVNEYGYTRLRFAGVLKAMIREFLKRILDEDQLDSYIEGTNKDRTIPLLGLTARDLMITLGTVWGRESVHSNIWVLLMCQQIEKVLKAGGRVVIDDLRFPNELDTVRNAGGLVYFIYRPSVTPQTPANAAEGMITYRDCDDTFCNASTVENLQWWVRTKMDQLPLF